MDFSRDSLINELTNTKGDYRNAIISYTDNLLSKGMPVIFSLKHFSIIMGMEYSDLRKILQCIDGYYAYFLIKKRNGGKRRLVVPYNNLKVIQRWILHEILEKVNVHPQCKGFVRGSGTLANALPHVGQEYIRKFDIKDFFENITVKRVYGIFREIGYSKAVSYDLASFCTLKLNDEKFNRMGRFKKNSFKYLHDKGIAVLAQGAPTSPVLSNLVCRHLDKRLENYAIHNGIKYTRYADDLTFSSNDPNKLPKSSFIQKVLSEDNFTLNTKKTGTFGKNSRQMVTGILINGDNPRVPQKFKRQIYRHLHFCQKFGPNDHFKYVKPELDHARQWLYGKIYYVNSIEPEEAKKMFAIADSLDWGLL